MNIRSTLAASFAAITIGSGAIAQDISFFLAEEGLSNPANVNSAAVDPARVNPVITTDGIATERLYIWALHVADNLECDGLGFNFSTTGTLVVNDVVLYNYNALIAGITWNAITNGAADGAGWSNASAISPSRAGLFSGPNQEFPGAENVHVINDAQLIGHIEVAGEGDLFFEVGQVGIIRELFESLPGPQVAFGFGDAPVSGSAYGTASSVADATLDIDECAGITPGDLNNDTLVDLLDVGFFEALVNSVSVPTQDQLCRADFNDDGRIDHFDQEGFRVALLGTPPAQSVPDSEIGFFLAVDGLSNPADFNSVAVNPARENPRVPYVGGSIQRLYIWSVHFADGVPCRGVSFNVQGTGSVVPGDLVIYDSSGFNDTWGDIQNGTGIGQRSENASAAAPFETGLATGPAQEISGFEHPHVIDDLQLVGHIDYAGVGEIFLEVGHSGITRWFGYESLPGPDVALGFGDARVSGSAYNTASTMADAVSICVGDLNGDLVVDTADLGSLISEFGTPGVLADINGDGIVDTADLGALIANFGSSCFAT